MRLTTDESYCDHICCDAELDGCGGNCPAQERWDALRDYEKRATPTPVKEVAIKHQYYTSYRIYCPKCGKQQRLAKKRTGGWYCERCGQALFYEREGEA